MRRHALVSGVVGVNSSGNAKQEVGEFLAAFPVEVTSPYLLGPNKTTDKLNGEDGSFPTRTLAASWQYGSGRIRCHSGRS
jgi:hypothetical protein